MLMYLLCDTKGHTESEQYLQRQHDMNKRVQELIVNEHNTTAYQFQQLVSYIKLQVLRTKNN